MVSCVFPVLSFTLPGNSDEILNEIRSLKLVGNAEALELTKRNKTLVSKPFWDVPKLKLFSIRSYINHYPTREVHPMI